MIFVKNDPPQKKKKPHTLHTFLPSLAEVLAQFADKIRRRKLKLIKSWLSFSASSPPTERPTSSSSAEEEDEHDTLADHTHGRFARSLSRSLLSPPPLLALLRFLLHLKRFFSPLLRRPTSGGSAGPTGGLQGPNGGDGSEEVHAGPAQCQLHAVAALRGGAAVLRLLQQPPDAVCSHGYLQQKPAGSCPKT